MRTVLVLLVARVTKIKKYCEESLGGVPGGEEECLQRRDSGSGHRGSKVFIS